MSQGFAHPCNYHLMRDSDDMAPASEMPMCACAVQCTLKVIQPRIKHCQLLKRGTRMSSSSRLPKSMQRTNRRTVLGSGLCASKMFKDVFYSSNHCRSPSSGEAPCCEHHGSSRKHRVPTYRVFNLSNRFTRVVPSPRHNQIWRHPRADNSLETR